MSEGIKHDEEKLRWDLLPGDAVREIVKVLTHGSKKYGDRNWEKGMSWSRPFGALMRHSWDWFMGEDNDPETGLSHMAHAGCCVLFLLAYVIRGMYDLDNRPSRRKDVQYEPQAQAPKIPESWVPMVQALEGESRERKASSERAGEARRYA